MSIKQNLKNINYIPQIHAYSTNFWKTLTGSPTYDASSKSLFVNAAAIASLYTFSNGGALRMEVKVPTAPTTGDVRQFGWRNPTTGEGIYFNIDGEIFSALTVYKNGDAESSPITWLAGWTNEYKVYEIVLNGKTAEFYIDGSLNKTLLLDLDASKYLAMPVYFGNEEADNMSVRQIVISGSEAINPIAA